MVISTTPGGPFLPGQTLNMITGSEEEAVAEGEEVKELPEFKEGVISMHALSSNPHLKPKLGNE